MIKDFIEKNELSFEEGNRNTTIVTLIGYSQHLGLTKEQLEEELKEQIEEDGFIQDEIDRLWQYCFNRNYKNYWVTQDAKDKYVF
jgi:hypothetical protein